MDLRKYDPLEGAWFVESVTISISAISKYFAVMEIRTSEGNPSFPAVSWLGREEIEVCHGGKVYGEEEESPAE